MDTSSIEKFLTPPQVAKRLGVAPRKVIGWILAGELEALDLSSRGASRPRYAISPDALSAFVVSRKVFVNVGQRAVAIPAPRVGSKKPKNYF